MKVIRILTICLIALLISMSTVHAQLVTVTSPKAGDTWKLGETKNIEWNYSGALPDLQRWKIVLMKGSTVLGTIADNVSGNRYSWRVGQYTGGNAPLGADYKIQVSNVSLPVINSNSGVFSIVLSSVMPKIGPSKQLPPMTAAPKQLPPMEKKLPPMEKKMPVRVISPNGGEKLNAGVGYTIYWGGTSVGGGGNVHVGLFRGSTEVSRLCTNVPNRGFCFASIDNDLNPYPVRVRVWSAGPMVFPYDESDGDVMITNFKHIKILSPNGGETWKLGDPLEIRWDTGGGWEGRVALFLYQGTILQGGIPLSFPDIPNTGAFTYFPPTIEYITSHFQIPNGNFGVCIKVLGFGRIIDSDCSDSAFIITR